VSRPRDLCPEPRLEAPLDYPTSLFEYQILDRDTQIQNAILVCLEIVSTNYTWVPKSKIWTFKFKTWDLKCGPKAMLWALNAWILTCKPKLWILEGSSSFRLRCKPPIDTSSVPKHSAQKAYDEKGREPCHHLDLRCTCWQLYVDSGEHGAKLPCLKLECS
jgi:hypothetical protein